MAGSGDCDGLKGETGGNVVTIEAVPGELGRFYVSSESRQGMLHLVDLHDKTCSCEQCQCKNDHACKHLRAVAKHELERLGI